MVKPLSIFFSQVRCCSYEAKSLRPVALLGSVRNPTRARYMVASKASGSFPGAMGQS